MQVKRDDDRWQTVNSRLEKEDEKWDSIRLEGAKAKKNMSNVAYNVVTMQYEQSTHGEHQKYLDDMVRYRAQERTLQLVEQGDTRVNYNIISGSSRNMPRAPAPVVKPSGLAGPKHGGGHH